MSWLVTGPWARAADGSNATTNATTNATAGNAASSPCGGTANAHATHANPGGPHGTASGAAITGAGAHELWRQGYSGQLLAFCQPLPRKVELYILSADGRNHVFCCGPCSKNQPLPGAVWAALLRCTSGSSSRHSWHVDPNQRSIEKNRAEDWIVFLFVSFSPGPKGRFLFWCFQCPREYWPRLFSTQDIFTCHRPMWVDAWSLVWLNVFSCPLCPTIERY